MTAEIAIMNGENIVIASDSLLSFRENRIFEGAKKLFKLSDKPPMALAGYGKAYITEMPLNSIVIDYVNETDFNKQNSLEKISEDFRKYIVKKPYLIKKTN